MSLSHYRINLFSDHKSSGTLSNATFHIHNNLFPNNRTDLMNGEWEVFLETFTGNFQTRVDPFDVGLKISAQMTATTTFIVRDKTELRTVTVRYSPNVRREFRFRVAGIAI